MPEDDGFIGPLNPDEPVYRIYPLWFFEEALRLKTLVLLTPNKWDDPFEFLPERSAIDLEGVQTPLEGFLKPAFAQCWSRTKESDTLWRAYSRVSKDPHTRRNIHPREEGVQVRSTPRKLLDALRKWVSPDYIDSCFIGTARYGSAEQIQQFIANRVGQHREAAFTKARDRAEVLLLKRLAFVHEKEVRLIYVEQRKEPPPEEKELIRVPIDPNALFDEVAFDPRLEPFERCEHEDRSRKLKYSGPFRDDGLYRGCLLQIIVEKP
jgi:hypothetical protein